MAARLGNVLYWLGCGLTAVFGAWTLLHIAALAGLYGGGTEHHIETTKSAIIWTLVAIGCWLVGRAVRHVLAGPMDTDHRQDLIGLILLSVAAIAIAASLVTWQFFIEQHLSGWGPVSRGYTGTW
jgi:hypothetical protein